eukprot:CAMPEP_0204619666 /NCGR_PEP_ID=MMETSP0717-20131115/5957_1 /ASSEMBLY_ACC=CAM_ASM_000666 /TAXON_ID=230516 /ORGANISM="Chaetoceros curvisetus" /LENGTH=60 /DNA_ID=CAMNT_0051633697 /DNA_START=1 /DNA_END=183 /DNA_ORIENTATION=-
MSTQFPNPTVAIASKRRKSSSTVHMFLVSSVTLYLEGSCVVVVVTDVDLGVAVGAGAGAD